MKVKEYPILMIGYVFCYTYSVVRKKKTPEASLALKKRAPKKERTFSSPKIANKNEENNIVFTEKKMQADSPIPRTHFGDSRVLDFFRTHRIHAAALAGLAVFAVGSLFISLYTKTHADIFKTDLYAGSCGGSWQNPTQAEGLPDVPPGAADFTQDNSAYSAGSGHEIDCLNFKGETPSEAVVRKFTLKFSWLVAASVVVPADSASVPQTDPTPQVPATNSTDAPPADVPVQDPSSSSSPDASTSQDVPSPPSPSDTEPASPTSFLQKLFSVVRAQDIPSSGDAGTNVVTVPADDLLDVRYSMNGTDWKDLGTVNAESWKDASFEIVDPAVNSFDAISKLQISVSTLPVNGTPPVVYLDGVYVEALYENVLQSAEPVPTDLPKVSLKDSADISLVSGEEDFATDDSPTFIVTDPKLSKSDVEELVQEKKAEVVSDPAGILGTVIEEGSNSSPSDIQSAPAPEAPTSSAITAPIQDAINSVIDTLAPAPAAPSDTSSPDQAIPPPADAPANTDSPPSSFLWNIFAPLKAFAQDVVASRITDVTIIGPDGNPADIPVLIATVTVDGVDHQEVKLQKPTRAFKPGKYALRITLTTADVSIVQEQDFTWGVLTLNTDRTIYTPGKTALMQMGVLDDHGSTICDASLDLAITTPAGKVTYLTTDTGGIKKSGDCFGNNLTDTPDYTAQYLIPKLVGTYQMMLTAVTANGTHTIHDSFNVVESVAFDIVRTAPTRINPIYKYPMTISITPGDDWSGTITEKIPSSFTAFPPTVAEGYSTMTTIGDVTTLSWNVSLKAGVETQLGYIFKAPEVSPEFYLLGPLSFFVYGTDPAADKPIYQEKHGWSIADDGTCSSNLSGGSGNWSSGATWTGSCTGASGIPGTGDTVGVTAGDTVTMTAASAVLSSLTVSGTLNTSNGTSWGLSTANLTIASSGTLTANASAITISGTTGTLMTLTSGGTFTAGTSTVSITGAANSSQLLNGGTGSFTGSNKFNNLTISNASFAAPMGAAIELGTAGTLTVTAGTLNTSTSNCSSTSCNITAGKLNLSGTLTANAATITLDATSGTLFTYAGTFTAGTSTVAVTSDSAVTFLSNGGTAMTFNTVTFNPVLSASRIYTLSVSTFGALTIPTFNITPSASSGTPTLTVNLGNTTTFSGTGTILIQGSSGANAVLDTTVASAFNVTASSTTLDLEANGTFNANSSSVINFSAVTLGNSSTGGTFNGMTANNTIATITIGNGGTFNNTTGTFTMSGTVTINSGGTMSAGSGIMTLTGTTGTLLTINSGGTFTAGTSTVNQTANASVTLNGGTSTFTGSNKLNNLSISNTGIANVISLGANLTVGATLTINGGTLDTTASNYALTVANYSDPAAGFTDMLKLNGSTMTLTGTGTLWSNQSGAAGLTAGTSTVVVANDAASTFISNGGTAMTFNTVTFNPVLSASRIYTLSVSTFGALTIPTFNITPSASSGTPTLTVNLGNTTTFSGTGTILIQGSSGANAVLDTTVASAFNVTASSTTLDLEANGTFNANSSSVINFSAVTLGNSSTGGTFNGMTANNTIATITIGNGGTFNNTTGTFTMSGTVTINSGGTMSAGSGTTTMSGTTGTLWTQSGTMTGASSTVAFTGAANSSQTFTSGSAVSFAGNVTLNNASFAAKLGAATTVVGTFTLTLGTLDTSASNCSSSSCNFTAGKIVESAGTITANAATITLTGTSGTLFTRSGTFTTGTSTVAVTSASGTPTLLSGTATFHILKINAPSATVINQGSAATIDDASGASLYVQAGVFNDMGIGIATSASTTNTLQIDSTGTLCIGGSTTAATTATCDSSATATSVVNMPAFHTYTLDSASTVRYLSDAGTTGTPQTISSTPVYGNLQLASRQTAARFYAFSGVTTINGNFTIQPTSGTFLLTVRAAGDISASAGTTTISRSASATSILKLRPVSTDYNLTTASLNIATGGTLDCTSAASLITVNGSAFTNNGTFTITSGTPTVKFTTTSAGTITVAGSNPFYNLSQDGVGGTVTLASAITVNNNMTLTNGTFNDAGNQITGNVTGTLSAASSTTLKIGAGSATTFPTSFTVGHTSLNAASTVIYNSTTTQTISGVPAYGNLQLSAASGTPTKTLGAATTINGSLTIDTSNTLDTDNTNHYNITLGGNFTNNGTFTARTGTVTLSGTVTQTLTGNFVAGSSSSFYDLTITNNSGTNPSDAERTSLVASVIFASPVTSTHTYTASAAHIRVVYNSGSTYTFTNIVWAGTSGAGNLTYFRNSAITGTWLLKVTGTQSVTYVDVSRSDASVSGGSSITATGGTNVDSGNNVNWVFVVATISGFAYNDGATTRWTKCDGSTANISLVVNGGTASTTTCSGSDGSYTFNSVSLGGGQPVSVFFNTAGANTDKGVAVTKTAATPANTIAGFNPHKGYVSVQEETSAASMTNANLFHCDSSVTGCTNVPYAVSSGNLSVNSGYTLNLASSATLAPGGNITCYDITVGGTLQLAASNLTANGVATINGTIDDSSATGTNTFVGAVTVGATGTWTSTGDSSYEFQGGLTYTSGGTFTSGSGTYVFSTNAQTISGTGSFAVSTISNTISSGNGLTFSGANPTVTTLTQSTNAVLTFGGTVPTITTLTATASPNTVQYTGSTQTVKATTYDTLTIAGSGTATLAGTTTANSALTISSGTLATANNALFAGTLTVSGTGTFTPGSSAISLSGTSGTLYTLSGSGTLTSNTAPITLSGNGSATVASGTPVFYSLTSTGTGTKSLGEALTVSGGLTVSNGTFDTTSGSHYAISTGIVTINGGTLSLNSSTLTLTGTSGTLFTKSSGTLSSNTAGVVVTSASGTPTFSSGLSAVTLASLAMNGAGTLSLGEALIVSGTLTATAGTLDTTSGSHYAVSAGTLTVNGGTLTLNSSNVSLTGTSGTLYTFSSGTITSNTAPITLSGNGSATIASGTPVFYSLTSTGTGTKSLGEALTATGGLTVSAGTLDTTSGSHYALTVGTITINGGTLTLNSSNVSITGTTGTLITKSSGTLTSNTAPITLSGNGSATISSGTPTLYSLALSSSTGTKTLGENLAFTGGVTVGSSSTLDSGSGLNYTISLGGSWSNSGTFTARHGTVTFNGSGAQSISGATSWYGLTIATTTARTISFQSSVTQTVVSGGTLTLSGASGQLLTLAPITAATTWLMNVSSGATQAITYVTASYSDATGSSGATVAANDGTSVDGGHNTNWNFFIPVYSVTVTANGSISYGALPASGSKSTVALGTTPVIQNDGNTTEDLLIKGQNTACPWTLSGTVSSDHYKHEFSTNGGSSYTALTTSDQPLVSGIATLGTQNTDLQITVPSSSACTSSQSADITITAVAP